MKRLALLIPFFLCAEATSGQPAPGLDEGWMSSGFEKNGDYLLYLGNSDQESSESSAILMAEQDAITQMIKHFFGVKMKYSLRASESMSSVSLDIDKSESSDLIEISGMVRSNVKVERDKSGKFKAWVRISIPEKSLRSEKRRLEAVHKAQLKEKRKNMVPKLFVGMPRDLFVKTYPAPNSIFGSYPSEIFHYQGWNFCDQGFLGCYVHFHLGKLVKWNSVNSNFVDLSKSAGR